MPLAILLSALRIILIFILLKGFLNLDLQVPLFYSNNNNNPNSTNNWWSNDDGSGTHPSDFTNPDYEFIIQSGDTYTANADWTVAGDLTILGDLITGNNVITVSGKVI